MASFLLCRKPQRLSCSSWPLLPRPFLPGSWPCLAIKLLQLPESSLAKWFFLSRFEMTGWHLSSFAGNPYMPQKLCCSFRPLFRSPFLPGSWPCLSIKPLASRLCLFLARSLAKCYFYRVSKLMDGIFPPLQETLRCLKGSAAALGHSCRTRFCQVPGHACRLSCQLPDFAFSWPRLLPNGVSIASRSCWMALFLRFRKPLYASKALLQL